jgi:hypothetical protein
VTSPLHDQPLLPHLIVRSLDGHDDAPCIYLAGRVATYAGHYPQYRDKPFDRLLVLRIVDVIGWSGAG